MNLGPHYFSLNTKFAHPHAFIILMASLSISKHNIELKFQTIDHPDYELSSPLESVMDSPGTGTCVQKDKIVPSPIHTHYYMLKLGHNNANKSCVKWKELRYSDRPY